MDPKTAKGLIVAGGLLLELLVIKNTWLAYSSRKWRQVPGLVLSSMTEESRQSDAEGRQSVSWRPKIKYSYDYEGQTHVGKRIAYSIMFGTQKQSDRLVSHFPKGKKVKVYIHPRKPKLSVILTKIDPLAVFISLIAPPVFTLIGLAAVRNM